MHRERLKMTFLLGGSQQTSAGPPSRFVHLQLNGVQQLRLPDIPVIPEVTVMLFRSRSTLIKSAPSLTMVMRLVGFDNKGSEQIFWETHSTTRVSWPVPVPGE